MGIRDTTGLAPHAIARMGVVRTFQDTRVVSEVSALENVMLAIPSQRGERLWMALLSVDGAAEEARNREGAIACLEFVGLQKLSAERAGELSYGQQKLLSLACCLATGAQIVLLDEPVAGVHPDMVAEVLNLLRRMRDGGKTVVLIEHDISAVRQVSEHLIVMDDGKVILEGHPHEVLNRREIMEAYLA